MKKGVSAVLVSLLLCWCTGLPAGAAEHGYTLNPGDVIVISVWKEEGLDREVLVLPDGTITFPLAGTISASGLTADELQGELVERIKAYIADPVVTVSVKAILGNKFFVVGQVNNPGEFVVGHYTSVMQLLSMAGGLTPYASEDDILIIRHQNGEAQRLSFRYGDVKRGKALETDLILKPGDVVVVPTKGLF